MTTKPDKLSSVRPQRRNANKHTQRGMGVLEQSIHADGWIGAITIAADGESFDGSARIEVGAAGGFDDAIIVESDGSKPIIHRRVDIPTADDPRAIRLGVAANRIAQQNLDWDAPLLAQLAQETDLSGLFTDEEINALLTALDPPAPGGGGDEFDTEAALEGPCRVAPGDLWLIGGVHRLLCGDSTDPATVARLMGGERATATITDPPYGIDASSMTMGAGESSKPKRQRLSYGQAWDIERPDISRLLGATEWLCVWGGNYFTDVLPPSNHWLCWHKKNDERSFSEFELAWTNYGRQARHLSHHWGGEGKEHITQKPLAVMQFSIEQCPDPSLIYDPFLGSGTTLIAAHRTGRRCYGLEISERYASVVLDRAEAEGLTCTKLA